MFSRHFLFVNVGRFAACFFLFNALALAQAPFRILHAFGGPNDGIYPDGQLLQDKSGNVYGTTQKGGSGYGTAFEISPSNGHWNETILYSFPGSASNLQGPSSNLVMDGAGNLYGTTFCGRGLPMSEPSSNSPRRTVFGRRPRFTNFLPTRSEVRWAS